MALAGTNPSHFDSLYAEQVRLLYANAPLAYSITLINGTILAYVQSTHIPTATVLWWYACLWAVTGGRALVIARYGRIKPGPERARFWNAAYAVGAALAGSVWGAAGLVLFPDESLAHQLFVAFVLAGMAAGGISVLAPRMEAALAFLLPTLLPLAIQYLTLRGPLHTAMGVMTLLFLAAMLFSVRTFHGVIRTSLHLRFDKQELQAEVARRQLAEERLSHEKDRLQTTVSAIGEGVALIDADGRIEYLNPAAEQLFGQSCEHVQPRPPDEVFECFDERGRRTTTALEDSLHSGEALRKRYVVQDRDGMRHAIEELATPLLDRLGRLAGAVSVFRDVTAAQELTEQLMHAADHDVLTGLPNRNLLKERIAQAVSRAHRKHESFALLFADLDEFKAVNDNLGHASGDALLVELARRLHDCVRGEDTVARLGGDEFVILIEGPIRPGQIEAIMAKIRRAVRDPFHLGKVSTTINASIGASLYPRDGHDADMLLGHADAAMYRAKRAEQGGST